MRKILSATFVILCLASPGCRQREVPDRGHLESNERGGSDRVASAPDLKLSGSRVPVFVDKGARVRPHARPSGRYSDKFPDIELVDHEGRKHRFYSDLVRDRIVVIQFLYTVCTGI